eukprot:GEMP01003473.1.p1 GENE.GEMP01003473.1~~GEMP01003473.1.p1  ORF type:complete len:1141 (+),score=260.53 GEMP01003473.1:192-3614(+)
MTVTGEARAVMKTPVASDAPHAESGTTTNTKDDPAQEATPWRLCPARHVVYDNEDYYYAFGNTPPAYLFPGVSPTEPNVRVLSIGCGDLRSPAYSLWREYTTLFLRGNERQHVTFTLNDYNPHVIARNVVLLDLMLHNNSSTDMSLIWAVWYSLGLTNAQMITLRAALVRVAAMDEPTLRAARNITFVSRTQFSTCQMIIAEWASWEPLALSDLQRMRNAVTLRRIFGTFVEGGNCMADVGKCLAAERLALAQVNMTSLKDRGSAIMEEVVEFFVSGVCQVKEGDIQYATVGNPTLMQRRDTYTLHDGIPFDGFAWWQPKERIARDRPVLHCCFDQFTQWVTALRARQRYVEWVFSIDDGLALCATSPSNIAPFRVIASSNVADHAGLLPLLVASRSAAIDNAVLLTSTLLHLSYSTDKHDYLRQNLIIPPSDWPSVFGWRCVGYEGAMAAESSVFQSDEMIDIGAYVNKDMGGTARTHASFHWIACPANSGLLRGTGNSTSEPLYALRQACEIRGNPVAGMIPPHPGTLLPLLHRFCNGPAQLHDTDGETRALYDLAYGIRPREAFVVASIPYQQGDMLELQPIIRITLTFGAASSRPPHTFTSLWTTRCALTRRTTVVHWVCDRAVLDEVQGVVLHDIMFPLAHYDARAIQRAPLGPGPVLRLPEAEQAIVSPDCCVLSESEMEFRYSIAPLPAVWWTLLQQDGFTLDVQRTHVATQEGDQGDYGVTVGIIATQKKKRAASSQKMLHAWTLSTSAPIVAQKTRLLLSRKRQSLDIILPKARYPFTSTVLGTCWADDIGHGPNTLLPQGVTTVSGLQMTKQEKFVARSREPQEVPPLIALKYTMIGLFQIPDPYQAIAVGITHAGETPDIHAVFFHHGLLQNTQTGVLFADISICLLTVDIVLEAAIPFKTFVESSKCKTRTIFCTGPEYDLLKQVIQLAQCRMKSHAPHLKFPRKKWAKKHFRRVLLPALFPHHSVTSADLNDDRLLTTSLTPAQLKDKGNAALQQGKVTEAMKCYQTAVVNHQRDNVHSNEEDEAIVACYLNLAHCNLKRCADLAANGGQKREWAVEARVCADRATKILGPSGNVAKRGKALYRRGMALELLGDMAAAVASLRVARELSPNDNTIVVALEKLTLNSK